MGHKAADTTHNINDAFGPGTANKCTGQWWFKKFCKDESLEGEEWSGWLLDVDNDLLRAISEADPLSTIWEIAEELNVNHSMVIWHLKQIGKVKKLGKWVPHELTENKKKIIVLKCRLLLFYTTTMNHFSIELWHAMKIGFYMATGDNQLNDWTESKLQITSQSQTCTKKR